MLEGISIFLFIHETEQGGCEEGSDLHEAVLANKVASRPWVTNILMEF